jgi:hypothetical protein
MAGSDSLEGKQISATYKDLLQVPNANSGVDGTLRTVMDGEGTESTLQVSTAGVKSTGTLESTGNLTVGGTLTLGGTAISSLEDGADVTDATNVEAAGALMDSELTDLSGVKSVTISTLQPKPSEGAFADGDKTKLDGIATGATANDTDANLKARANHTGTQTASTISDFDTEVANNSAVAANTAKVSNATHTGDATGSTALTVEKIQGRSVASTAPSDGQVLKWVASASEWQPSADNTGSGGGGGGSGTVTSVAITGSDGIDVDSGSPITSSGTIALGLSNIGDAAISSASTWNAKQDAVTAGTGLSFTGSTLNAEVTQSELDAKQDSITAGTGLSFTGSTLNAEVTQSEVDAKQDALTFGIANTNAVKVDSADVADDEYARFTANGLESRSGSEVLSDIGAAASSHNHNAYYLQISNNLSEVTASTARTNLGLGDAATGTIGTDVQAYDADTSKTDVATEWTAAQNFNSTTLTFDATQDWDLSTNQVCQLTLTGNTTFDAPTNIQDGGFYSITLIQDGTGSRTAAWNAVFKWAGGTAPTLTTTASAKDILVFRGDGTNLLEVGRQLNVS